MRVNFQMKNATMPRTATPPATLNPTIVDVDTPESSFESLPLFEPAAVLVELAALADPVTVSEIICTNVEPAALVVTTDEGVGVGVTDAPVFDAAADVGELLGEEAAAEDWVVEEAAVLESDVDEDELDVVVDEVELEVVVVELVAVELGVDATAVELVSSSPPPSIPARL